MPDDKELVIACTTILGLAAMFAVTDPESIIMAVITGLCGLAIGRANKPN